LPEIPLIKPRAKAQEEKKEEVKGNDENSSIKGKKIQNILKNVDSVIFWETEINECVEDKSDSRFDIKPFKPGKNQAWKLPETGHNPKPMS